MIFQIFLVVLFFIPDIVIHLLGTVLVLGAFVSLVIGNWEDFLACLASLLALVLLYLFVGGGWKLLLYLFAGLVLVPLAMLAIGVLMIAIGVLAVVCSVVFVVLQQLFAALVKWIREKFAKSPRLLNK